MLPLVFAIAIAVNGGERTYPVTTFHAVELTTKATVRVEQAAVPSVTASGDPRFVRCVTADVRGGRLVIGWARGRNASARTPGTDNDIVVMARTDCPHESDPQRLVIRVGAPSIDEVALRSFGAIQVLPMSVPTLTASIYERGNIAINGLRAGATRLSIPGIGRITTTGELGRLTAIIGGKGEIDAKAARAAAADVTVAGAGVVWATVNGPVTGAVGGEGVVSIAGHPACQIRNPGRGRIVCPARE